MMEGVDCVKGKVKWNECIKCKERCFPLFVLDIFLKNNHEYNLTRPTFTVSKLCQCLRKTYLEETLPFYISPFLVKTAVIGILIHKSLSDYFKGKEGYVTETMVKKEVGGVEVAGTFDLYSTKTKTLYDFKVSNSLKEKYILQLNMYKELVDFEVEKLKVVLIDLSRNIQVVEINKREPILEKRVRVLKKAFDTSVLPLPEKTELCKYCYFKEDCK